MRPARSTSGTPLANWTAAVVVGLAGVAIHLQPPGLADPARCPGLLELLSVAAVRAMPAAPLTTIFHLANTVATFVALVAVVRALQILTGSTVRSASAGAALAATSLFMPTLTPPHALGLAVAAATLIAVIRCLERNQPALAAIVKAWLGLATLAAIASPLALPLAAVAALMCWLALGDVPWAHRTGVAAAAAIGVGVAPFFVALALPVVPILGSVASSASCVFPQPGAWSAHAWVHSARSSLSYLGPFAMTVAALGAFGARRSVMDPRAWPAIALTVVPVLFAWRTDTDLSLPALAPAIVGFWCLVALGLGDIVAATRRGILGGLAAALFIGAVPVLQAGALRDPVVPPTLPSGHESLSNASFARLIRVLPPDARLVVEDAMTDILLRAAAAAPSFTSKRISLVARDPEAVNEALASHEVFALPSAQAALQNKGLRLTDAEPRVSGLSRVVAGGACGTVTNRWTSVPGLVTSDRMALVADSPDVYGPIVVYLASDRALAPRPIGWPDRARRGFFVSVYDTSHERDRQRLDEDVSGDGAARQDRAIDARVVTRLELWRVPGAPLELVVGLDRVPAAALTRTVRGTDEPGLHVCPAFGYAPTRLEPVR